MAAGEELVGALADTTTYLTKHDQALRLRSLKSKVLDDVKFLIDAEDAARSGFIKGRLISAPLSFAIGGLAGVLLQNKEPLQMGLNAASSTIGKKFPFGTVLVAIGHGGIPDDVKAVPVSALARQSAMTESAVRKTVVAKGYFLITPKVFAAAMDDIEHFVLESTLSLPVLLNEVKKYRQLLPGPFHWFKINKHLPQRILKRKKRNWLVGSQANDI
jgi:hypothetical protein